MISRGCSTEIIAGLSVMFYREHEFMMLIILKWGLGINPRYILVYFPTVKI
jgi:hypothetical protein